jgi:hypothetical protein
MHSRIAFQHEDRALARQNAALVATRGMLCSPRTLFFRAIAAMIESVGGILPRENRYDHFTP